MFAIKVRKVGSKSWAFLSRNGTNRLRIHACRFQTAEDANSLIEANRPDNSGWEWKVVPL